MKQVRVGIVGMGIGKDNARAIERNPRGSVVALCDLLPERMTEFAKEFSHEVKQYTDLKQMCADPEIDAVFIGTPNQWHVPCALEAVKRDKHVMVTKPLSDSLTAARKLVDAQEKAGVVGMMSLSTRFGNEARYLGDRARAGEFGELYYGRAKSVRRAGIPDWNTGFIAAGGGAFRDMGVHVLDCAWWLLGLPEPETVTGVSGAKFGPRGQHYWDFREVKPEFYQQYDSDDYGCGFVRFANGAGLQVESFWASHMPPEFQIELFGTEAGATMSPLRMFKTVGGAPTDTSIALPHGPNAWDNIAAHFIDTILDETPCSAPLRHGMIVQELLEALLKSATTGKEVKVGGK